MSFEANKIAGAILAAMILAMVSGILSNMLVRPSQLDKPAYAVAGAPAEDSGSAAPAAPAGPDPIAGLMANANADAGKAKTTQCAACHSFDKGGANRIGPNLWGVVNSPIAEDRGGFAFSTALSTKGKGQTWTLDNLNAWLWKPQTFASGTKMTFIGLPKAEDRANVIAYLNSQSDSPVPVAQLTQGAASAAPAAAAPAAPAAAAPAGGAAPAQGDAAKPAAAPAGGAAPAQGDAAKPAAAPTGSAAPGAAPAQGAAAKPAAAPASGDAAKPAAAPAASEAPKPAPAPAPAGEGK